MEAVLLLSLEMKEDRLCLPLFRLKSEVKNLELYYLYWSLAIMMKMKATLSPEMLTTEA